jgi:hypothetical protein
MVCVMPLAVVACSVCHSIRRVLRRGHEHVTEVARDRLLTGLDVGDVDEAVWASARASLNTRPI